MERLPLPRQPAENAMRAGEAPVCGVVVIGRNEGERLRRCLDSALPKSVALVYVDSGSTDGSADMARSLGATVLGLDMSRPFTAARARNAGFARLEVLLPTAEFVQFVDGDCEIAAGWVERAAAFLREHPEVAAVCGRLRERFPERSAYNLLCDMEWDTPIGEAKSCGGIVLMRAAALKQVGGFRDDLIAGEEPELCVRLRARGWRIWRLDAEMALHDAAMLRFSQWWTRTMRGGFAFAAGAQLHGAAPERHCVREVRSAWLWGAVIPLSVLLAVVLLGPWFALLLLVYPLQIVRLGLRNRGSRRQKWLRAFFLVLGKFPELIGQIRFAASRLMARPNRLIEYK